MARTTPGEPYAFGDDAINGIGGEQAINLSFSTTINTQGSTMGQAEFQRILDQRDENILARVPMALAEAQLHRKT